MSSGIKGTGVKFKFTRTDGTVIESDEFTVPAGKDGTRIFTVQSGEVALSGNWTAYLTQDDYEQAKVGDLVIGKNGIIGNILNKYPTNTVAGLNGVDVKSTQCFTAFSGDVNIIGDWTVQLALDDYASVRIGDTVIGKNGVIGTVRYKYPDNIATGNGGVSIVGSGVVSSVNGQTGDVTLTAANIGAVNKAGDTMDGNLVVQKTIYPSVQIKNLTTDHVAYIENSGTELDIIFRSKENVNFSYLSLEDGIINSHAELRENGQRVYSPNNPPPASGGFHLYQYGVKLQQELCVYEQGHGLVFNILSSSNYSTGEDLSISRIPNGIYTCKGRVNFGSTVGNVNCILVNGTKIYAITDVYDGCSGADGKAEISMDYHAFTILTKATII